MTSGQRQRCISICLASVLLVAAVTLCLYALRQNINLYFTPTELRQASPTPVVLVRVGGVVVPGSIHRSSNGLAVRFTVTDHHDSVTVAFRGMLPDLFRAGQGIVAQGHYQRGELVATQVLAKHDQNYHPPGIKQLGDVSAA